MSRPGSHNTPAPPLSPERARRWCLLSSLRTLHYSIQRGRTISLPNLLRLYQRRYADRLPAPVRPAADLEWLTRLYRQEQPFRATDWREWRRAVG